MASGARLKTIFFELGIGDALLHKITSAFATFESSCCQLAASISRGQEPPSTIPREGAAHWSRMFWWYALAPLQRASEQHSHLTCQKLRAATGLLAHKSFGDVGQKQPWIGPPKLKSHARAEFSPCCLHSLGSHLSHLSEQPFSGGTAGVLPPGIKSETCTNVTCHEFLLHKCSQWICTRSTIVNPLTC